MASKAALKTNGMGRTAIAERERPPHPNAGAVIRRQHGTGAAARPCMTLDFKVASAEKASGMEPCAIPRYEAFAQSFFPEEKG
jgi:hypothetical protein